MPLAMTGAAPRRAFMRYKDGFEVVCIGAELTEEHVHFAHACRERQARRGRALTFVELLLVLRQRGYRKPPARRRPIAADKAEFALAMARAIRSVKRPLHFSEILQVAKSLKYRKLGK